MRIDADTNRPEASDLFDKPLPRAKHGQHQKAMGVRLLQMLTRLLTLVQVGDCWKYALEAIIKLFIIIFHVYDKCLLSMLLLY